MIARLLTPLSVIALGVLVLLQGLDEISPSGGIVGAAVLTVAGVALLVSGLNDDDSGGA